MEIVELHSETVLALFNRYFLTLDTQSRTQSSTGTRWFIIQGEPSVAVLTLNMGSSDSGSKKFSQAATVCSDFLESGHSHGHSTQLKYRLRFLKEKITDVLFAMEQRIENAFLEHGLGALTIQNHTSFALAQMKWGHFLATQLRAPSTKLLSAASSCWMSWQCHSSNISTVTVCNGGGHGSNQGTSVLKVLSMEGTLTTLNHPLQKHKWNMCNGNWYHKCYSIQDDVQKTTDFAFVCSKIGSCANSVYEYMKSSGQHFQEELLVKIKSGKSNAGSWVTLYTSLLSLLVLLLLSSASNCLQGGMWRPRSSPTFIFVAIYSFHSVSTLPSPCQNEIWFTETRVVRAEGTGTVHRVSLRGSPNAGFCARISVGMNALQEFCVLVDTGSANLAIAGQAHLATNNYFQVDMSSSYTDLGTSVSVSYTAGEWTGTLSQDYISIGGASRILAHFVLITKASQFFLPNAEWEGILGMAYSSLVKPDSSVKTFWDSFREVNNMEDVFSIQLCPPVDNPLHNQTELRDGIMVLGGSDSSDYRGAIHFTDIIEEKYYSVVITNLTVGDIQINIPCKEFNNDQTIVDSGTTDIFFPVKVFTELTRALSSNIQSLTVPESFWVSGSKLAWPTTDKSYIYDVFPTLFIGFATSENSSLEFSLAITPQIYLRQVQGSHDEQVQTNCLPDCDFFEFGIKRRERGAVIGGNVMLGFYTIFNRKNGQVGFAESTYCEYQDPTTLPYIVGPYQRVPEDCECHGCGPGLAYWEIISYVCGAIVFTVTVILLVYVILIRRIHKSCKKRRHSFSTKNPYCIKCLCCCCCCKYKKLTIPASARPKTEDSTQLLPSISECNDHHESQEDHVRNQTIHVQETTVVPDHKSNKTRFDEIETDFEGDPESTDDETMNNDVKDVEDSGFTGDERCDSNYNSSDHQFSITSSIGSMCLENEMITVDPAAGASIDPEQSITYNTADYTRWRQASTDSGVAENEDSLSNSIPCKQQELHVETNSSSEESSNEETINSN